MMHFWGDEWFQKYGDDLNKAIAELNQGMRKIHVLCLGKEKYGTFRTDFFCLWCGSWSEWARKYGTNAKFDRFIIKLNRIIGVTWIIRKWQIKEINKLFQTTCKKYPHLVDELVSDTDCYMYIKPGKYGVIDGERIHNKYWKQILN